MIIQLAHRDFLLRLVFFSVGFTAIASLALALIELIPLCCGLTYILIPGIILGLVLAFRYPAYGKLALWGWLFGLLAVTIYDLTRFPFVYYGIWNDFIPKIGDMLLDRENTHWIVGYAWRYLGNGAGMGMAFVMLLPLADRITGRRRAAILYGISIWLCLLTTLVISRNGSYQFISLNPTTFSISLLGHLVYGGVLGILCRHWSNKTQLTVI